jgi:hypothetical protein
MMYAQVNGSTATPTHIPAVTEISNTGAILSGPMGLVTLSDPNGVAQIAVDGSGNVWVLNWSGFLSELVGAATPVTTPFSVGVKNGTLGQRP